MNFKLNSLLRIYPHNIDILSVLFGSLLGDSYADKRLNKGTRFQFTQSSNNMEYLYWLHSFFALRGYCSSNKPTITYRIGNNGKKYYSLRFSTYTYFSFDYIYDLFYKEGKKIIPMNLGDYLTPLALAIWICDDGGVVSAGLKLCTNCFKKEEVLYLISILKKVYNIDSNIQSAGSENQYIIYIPKSSMLKLSKIVKPYMISSMHYKLNGF